MNEPWSKRRKYLYSKWCFDSSMMRARYVHILCYQKLGSQKLGLQKISVHDNMVTTV